MNKEFVMRGQTASGETEVLNFSGLTPGYAYRITEFSLYPSGNVVAANHEIVGTVTAGKTAVSPIDPNFNDEGLIAVAMFDLSSAPTGPDTHSIINDLFLITQDLILMVQDGSSANPINWQCKFVGEKLSTAEEAVTNYKQFTISNDD